MFKDKSIEALKDEAVAILTQAGRDERFLTEGESKRLQEIEEEVKKINYIKNCWEKFRREVWQSVEIDWMNL